MIKPSARRTRQKSNATRHVRDLLRVMVLSNRYEAHGGALPSEAELMLELGATRNVVREALGLLRDEGLIERLQGAGTFAVTHKILHRFDMLRGAGDGFPNRRQRIRGELPAAALIAAPPLVAAKLGLGTGQPCLQVDAWVAFDDVPFSLTTSYLRPEFEPRLRQAAFTGDWYELLESFGLSIGSCTMNVEAILADDVVAPWLDVEAGAPLVLFTRLINDAEERPVEYGFVRVRADRVLLNVGLNRSTAMAAPPARPGSSVAPSAVHPSPAPQLDEESM